MFSSKIQSFRALAPMEGGERIEEREPTGTRERIDGGSSRPVVIELRRATFVPLVCGALWWPDQAALIVADLHFEKASSLARRGLFLPPYDTTATLKRLGETIMAVEPQRVIALGDSFHDNFGPTRLAERDLELLHSLQIGRDWFWVFGNHDPYAAAGLPGEHGESVSLGGIQFRHEPDLSRSLFPGEAEVVGHYHPCARVRRRGRSVRRRCFICDGRRLVMPAYGALTGGLNVLNEAYETIIDRADAMAYLLGQHDIFPMARRQLKPD